MKNLRKMLWGIVLLAAAVLIALNSFDVIDFDVFFDGWWTLFIIIPSFVGIIEKRDKTGSIFALLLGVFLLLCAQDILSFEVLGKLILPGVVAYIGLKMIFSSARRNKAERIVNKIKTEGKDLQRGVAVFSGTEMNFDGAAFDGADLTACFGGLDCDLRGAIIDKDTVIKVCCVFGGIEIMVPNNVKVVSNAVSVFGGVGIDKSNDAAEHTIYIEGICMFGGVDIK